MKRYSGRKVWVCAVCGEPDLSTIVEFETAGCKGQGRIGDCDQCGESDWDLKALEDVQDMLFGGLDADA